ncbi:MULTISPECIES: Shedu anti-phage system protein SduA domain-containing protein [unclassified Methylobacterium]|jgi:hypothetical protein|uniref:Shedu anti-phage system protein SduA domain-containing protein n=1 Tax=unclassified Methylobacterium TaxID=2615210 RepID=UPI001354F337|nr:Shedu anti-phage system protein SduA domain-containing protein [Methylobacterium sp. 2A]MWV24786.1 DUF4263 domain-containing protein [Methylobacterium sp. 2A]
MSSFERIKFDLRHADTELISFKAWLATASFVGETVIVAEIKKRRHMACLLASTLGLPAPDMIKFELALKGMFRTDLVLGNDGQRRFGLVEFEDAEATSIFRRGTVQYRFWSPRIGHGFSQILDWAWVRSDHPNDSVLLAGFGGPITTSAYAVICGRDASLADDVERKRFKHRRDHLKVEGQPALVLTYDEMVRSMEDNLAAAKTWS